MNTNHEMQSGASCCKRRGLTHMKRVVQSDGHSSGTDDRLMAAPSVPVCSCAGHVLQPAGPAFCPGLSGLRHLSFIRALGELVLRPRAAASSYAREFLGEKPLTWPAGCTSLTGDDRDILSISPPWRCIWPLGAFGDVPQWVFALGALAIVGTIEYDRGSGSEMESGSRC